MTTPKLSNEYLLLREMKSNDIFGYYEILSDAETMQQFGGPPLNNDIERKDIVEQLKIERERNLSFFWSITLKHEREFIGFIRLLSYKSSYYDLSFSAMGEARYSDDFLNEIDRNGWEIDYVLLKEYRNKGIMKEAMGLVLDFSDSNNITPIYAKVNSVKNIPSIRVLAQNSFIQLMPLMHDNPLTNTLYAETIIKDKNYGMMFVKR